MKNIDNGIERVTKTLRFLQQQVGSGSQIKRQLNAIVAGHYAPMQSKNDHTAKLGDYSNPTKSNAGNRPVASHLIRTAALQ